MGTGTNDNGALGAPGAAGAGASCPVPTRLIAVIAQLGHLMTTKPSPNSDPTEVAADLLELLNTQNQQLRKALSAASDRLREIPLLSDRKAALPVFHAAAGALPDDGTDADGNVGFTKQACIHLVNWLNDARM